MKDSTPTPGCSDGVPARISFDGKTWSRFIGAVRAVATSEVGPRFRRLFLALIALMFAIHGLNVVNSYVGRDFMTAIEQRDTAEFVSKALLYVALFAASTAVAGLLRFIEELLGLLWRSWLTHRHVERYLGADIYFWLKERGAIGNPDQRITEDVRSFTTVTLSLVIMLLNATFTIVAFSGVMWSISPLLFLVAIAYAGAGSVCTVLLGRPLVRLNYAQSDCEASFRADLVHVRENSESIALLEREGRLSARLRRRLDGVIANMRRIISVNRNLTFFTSGFNYGIQIIPALIIGPLFIRGAVEFGVITQSAIAFAHLLGAFSLIITQFASISSYAAVLARLSSLASAVEEASIPPGARIESVPDEKRLAYEGLTLRSASSGEVLVERLDAAILAGSGVFVAGPDQAQIALFRATAGLWEASEGRIVRPPAGRILFLPERPYLPPGTLREALLRTGREAEVGDEDIFSVLRALDLESVVARVGGLDLERDWDDQLSLAEQQLFSVARIRLAAPAFALLQAFRTTLDAEQVERVHALLSGGGITCVGFGRAADAPRACEAVLEIREGGAWSWRPPESMGQERQA